VYFGHLTQQNYPAQLRLNSAHACTATAHGRLSPAHDWLSPAQSCSGVNQPPIKLASGCLALGSIFRTFLIFRLIFNLMRPFSAPLSFSLPQFWPLTLSRYDSSWRAGRNKEIQFYPLRLEIMKEIARISRLERINDVVAMQRLQRRQDLEKCSIDKLCKLLRREARIRKGARTS
jgi:hypothetical protein